MDNHETNIENQEIGRRIKVHLNLFFKVTPNLKLENDRWMNLYLFQPVLFLTA